MSGCLIDGWDIRKGYLKIDVAVDIKKKIVSLDVTSEEVCNGSRLKELVDNVLETILQKEYLQMEYMIIMKIFNIFWIRTLNPQLKQEKIFIRQINRMLPRRRVVLKQLTNFEK